MRESERIRDYTIGPSVLCVDALYKLTFTYLLTYLLTYISHRK